MFVCGTADNVWLYDNDLSNVTFYMGQDTAGNHYSIDFLEVTLQYKLFNINSLYFAITYAYG